MLSKDFIEGEYTVTIGMESVDIKEAAKILHLHEDTVSEYLRKGILKGEKRPLWAGRSYKWFIPKSECEKYSPPHVFSRHIPTLSKDLRAAVAWAIAAEGTITINPYHSRSHKGYALAYPCIAISNTEKDFVEKFYEIVGRVGIIVRNRRSQGVRKASWQWQLRCIEGCLKLLEQIFEYLPIKKEQATITMEYCRSRLTHLNKPLSDYEVELINKVRILNTRGRRKKIVPREVYNQSDMRRRFSYGTS